MATTPTALKQLDKALKQVRDLGLSVEPTGEAPIGGLLEQIYDLDRDNIAVIAKTLAQVSLFNEIVRNEISEMHVGQRYEDIVYALQLDPRRRQASGRPARGRQDQHARAGRPTSG